jgi:hypothetical protein
LPGPELFICHITRSFHLPNKSLSFKNSTMKFLSLLTPIALSAWTVQAHYQRSCLTDAVAKSIADRSAIFLQHTDVALANATAQELFAENIIEYGDSINSLRGDPVSFMNPQDQASGLLQPTCLCTSQPYHTEATVPVD